MISKQSSIVTSSKPTVTCWNRSSLCLKGVFFLRPSADIFLLSCLQLDVADLKQQLARSQTLFPENPSVWIKDLAGYLNLHLTAQDTEPTLSSHPYGQADSYFDMPIYLSCG